MLSVCTAELFDYAKMSMYIGNQIGGVIRLAVVKVIGRFKPAKMRFLVFQSNKRNYAFMRHAGRWVALYSVANNFSRRVRQTKSKNLGLTGIF